MFTSDVSHLRRLRFSVSCPPTLIHHLHVSGRLGSFLLSFSFTLWGISGLVRGRLAPGWGNLDICTVSVRRLHGLNSNHAFPRRKQYHGFEPAQ